ncbi:hypothetical protein C0995_008416 [Termitomyces sp. Mi166|nr:hypothetical protein C0995_008416 [Termitomyces sp. Mi166\
MLWLQVLPLVLVALTLAHAATSPNDPLRALALQVPKKPELPICCLKPQQPLDTVEDEILLSFEEWKRQQSDLINHITDTNNTTDETTFVNTSDVPATHVEEAQKPPPHFRVPLTDRFNYASSECSARVHLAHRDAKSASSILSSKRDRYMLSPCNAENQFVIVELCEDIRIDTVQLANFEFFSGIFKDFKLSVAKTDMTAEGAFTDAGVFRAKNVRGVQSFHPPTSLRDFYRYIRIDFLSHYGNEFYCPVSLLRVYGLTHLEQWKWDTWEQESREKVEAPKVDSVSKEESTSTLEVAKSTEYVISTNVSLMSDASKETSVTKNSVISSSIVMPDSVLDSVPSAAVPDTYRASEPMTPPPVSTPGAIKEAFSTPSNPAPTSSTTAQPNASTPLLDASQNLSTTHAASSPPSTTSNNPKVSTSSTALASVFSTPISNSNSKPPAPNPSSSLHPSQGPGGESIYRTIMNRLTALEANHTLYARYVEQQTSGVREVLRRMGEDVGRLEGIVRAQGQVHSKTLRASEERMQTELGELMRRVESLRGEIEMEKRVGVAQVCLLAAVLVFMGLTRGSRGDQGVIATAHGAGTVRRQGMREWGKRLSSLSGDWRFRRKKSEDPFDQADDRPPFAPKTNMRSISSQTRVPHPRSRSRTPSMRTRQHLHHPQLYIHHSHSTLPETPTRIRTPMHMMPLQRSSSGFSTGHRSARRWARTSHLHEVRGSAVARNSVHRRRGDENENDPAAENPFWDGPRAVGKEQGKGKKGERERKREREGEEKGKDEKECERDKTVLAECEGDVWVDTDTDLEEDADLQVSHGNGNACE